MCVHLQLRNFSPPKFFKLTRNISAHRRFSFRLFVAVFQTLLLRFSSRWLRWAKASLAWLRNAVKIQLDIWIRHLFSALIMDEEEFHALAVFFSFIIPVSYRFTRCYSIFVSFLLFPKWRCTKEIEGKKQANEQNGTERRKTYKC